MGGWVGYSRYWASRYKLKRNEELIITELQTTEKVLTSLEVAEMVGKQHKNVMQDIRGILKDFSQLNIQPSDYFVESTYKNSRNKEYPMFLLTKQGCELYGNRMTGIDGTAFAVKYIERFNAMEEVLQQPKLPTSYKEALIALVEAEEVKEAMEAQLALAEPKLQALDSLTGNTDTLHTTTQIATNYGMSAIKMNKLLHQLGVQYKQTGVWKLYAKYEGKGYTATPMRETEDGYVYKTMLWTPKGEYFLYKLLIELGYTSTSYDLMFNNL